MIYKILRGPRIIFLGPKEEIIPLFNSAFNWGAIDTRLPCYGFDERGIEEDGLTDVGLMVSFSVRTRKIMRWRLQAELTRFDVDRILSIRLLKKLARKVKKWLESFEVISYLDYHCVESRSFHCGVPIPRITNYNRENLEIRNKFYCEIN